MGGAGPWVFWTVGGLVAAGLVWRPQAVRLLRRLLDPAPRDDTDQPVHRPIERLAGRLRVLGPAYHFPLPGTPRTRRESVRLAYDDCLAEACDSLGLPHLLELLPDGDERDVERARVEVALMGTGLDFGLPLA